MLKTDVQENADRVTYFLKGELNETGELPELKPTSKKICIDFGGLLGINSVGVLKWLRWLPGKPQLILANCPTHLMQQMSIVPTMVGDNVTIESFYVPLYCDRCEKEDFKKMTPSEFKSMDKDAAIRSPECADNNCAMSLDCVPDRYLRLLK